MEPTISSNGKSVVAKKFTYQEKLEAIHRVRNGESKASVARSIAVPESTLRGWCKNEARIFHLSGLELTAYPKASWTGPWQEQPGSCESNSEALDYRKEVLNSKRASKAMELNYPAMKRTRIANDLPYRKATPHPNRYPYNHLDNNVLDRTLQTQWTNFLRQQLYQKRIEQSRITAPTHIEAAMLSPTVNIDNGTVLSNPYCYYNWYRQWYTNQQAQYRMVSSQIIARAELQQRFNQVNKETTNNIKNYMDYSVQQGTNQLNEEPPDETVNENNNNTDDGKDTNCWLQQEINQSIEGPLDETTDDESNTDDEEIDQTAALKHGEEFLKWLENCNDPNVTALQVSQFKKLLNRLNSENVENER